ncbi:hypothetical protein [Sphingomonas sp. Leaf343]|uniref:hypothetical protein n=1 Tax=Sphingomonas sp. Leaf343 TaxID=1736345 RepID=UPI0006F1F8EB|nr:hypothetical protein [Sphingomonas sp. Leaf343]KQR83272.1 hypothetical protein ASG07_10000 [Sphingomonas sp. Leaf343]
MPLPTFTTKTRAAIAAVALLAAGGTAGVVAGHALQPSIEMAPMRPVPIRSLVASDTGVVTVRARVAEVFGNTFIADDGTGRALVDLGRAGDDTALVTAGQTVSVQGRYDKGMLRASFLVDGANKVTSLRPMGPPPGRGHGPDGGPDHRGPDHRGPKGPRGDAPPPAGAAAPVPAAAAPTQPAA